MYNQITKQFNTTLQKLPLELSHEIEDDFMREKFERLKKFG